MASRTGAETPLAGQGAAASFTWAQVVLEFGGPRKFEGWGSFSVVPETRCSFLMRISESSDEN